MQQVMSWISLHVRLYLMTACFVLISLSLSQISPTLGTDSQMGIPGDIRHGLQLFFAEHIIATPANPNTHFN